MAIVSAGRFMTVSLKDTSGDRATRTFQLVATDDTQAQIDAASILTKLLAVTTAKMDSYSISEKFVDDAFTLPALSEVHDELLVTMPIAGKPNKSGTVIIPSPEETLFVSASGEGNKQPDFGVTALISYLDIFTAVGNQAKISDGEIATLVNAKGKRVHSKS